MTKELKPFPYQEKGRDWTIRFRNVINGDTMGLGKTIQTILAIEKARRELGFNHPILVVCPASLKYNWQQEIHKWSDKKAVILTKDTFSYMMPIFSSGTGDYFIVNYESLHLLTLEINTVKEWWINDIIWNKNVVNFKWVVVDESQRLNTFKTRQYKLSLGLVKVCKPQYITNLSGTIITNQLSDLVPQLYFLDRLKYFAQGNSLRELEIDFINRWQKNLTGLGERLRKVCYFRREKDVLNLAPITRQILRVDLDKESKKAYSLAKTDLRQYLLDYKDKTKEEAAKSMRGKIMVQYQSLREIAAKGKAEAVKDFVNSANENNEKVVIFGIHKSVTRKLVEELGCLGIYGGVSAEQRQKNVNAFQSDPKEKNIVCSIKSGGVGITLVAARFIVFAEQWFNPSQNDQVESRVHRIGTERNVFAIYIIAKDSIDEKMWLKCEKRREISKEVDLITDKTDWNIIDKIYDKDESNVSDDEFDMFVDVLQEMI